MAVWWNCQHRSSECAWYFEHDPQRHKVTCYESAWDAGRSAMWMALQYMERGNRKQRPLNSPLKRVCGARFVGLVVANFDSNQFRWNFCHYLAYFASLHIDLVHNTSGCQIYSQWTATEFRAWENTWKYIGPKTSTGGTKWFSDAYIVAGCTISWEVHTAIGGRFPHAVKSLVYNLASSWTRRVEISSLYGPQHVILQCSDCTDGHDNRQMNFFFPIFPNGDGNHHGRP